MKRRPNLSFRSPEPTSVSRATAFNRTIAKEFFENLREVKAKYQFQPHAIFNVDETAINTVHKPPKVIAKKGSRQVGQTTSAERGELVTLIGAANASGNAMPPYLVFPRRHFKEHFLNGGPVGVKGTTNPFGWSNADIFVGWLQHFQHHSICSKQHPVLLIFDNHSSDISIKSLEFATQHGIVMLTIPPHTSNKLQPLDRTVYGSLK